MVCYDYDAKKVAAIPEKLKIILEGYNLHSNVSSFLQPVIISISKPFTIIAPCSSPFCRNKVLAGLYTRSNK